ncbi:tyrosine-type recombinase/integrase [Ktedonobacteria bacterium brp13]|nr:tyrosine-type recombinase/integrase [Ktedonobacteria bacterium brp13]
MNRKKNLTEEHLLMLREGLRGHHLETMILLALVTGIRRDELRRLTWSEIDLQTGVMHVLNVKTKNSVRQIHLPENVVFLLRQHALRQEQQSDTTTARSHLGLVFPDGTGGELSIQRFLQDWYAALEQVGLPRRCFHSVRFLVGRRLFTQQQADRERCDGKKGDLGKNSSGEEPHDE